MTEPPVFDVSGYREPVCGLASEAVGSTDEGREHRVDRVFSTGLWAHQFPCVQVYQGTLFYLIWGISSQISSHKCFLSSQNVYM